MYWHVHGTGKLPLPLVIKPVPLSLPDADMPLNCFTVPFTVIWLGHHVASIVAKLYPEAIDELTDPLRYT